jgi:hypothetical protein
MQEEPLPAQASVIRIGQLSTALDHPGAIRLAMDPDDLHPPRREVDHEQDGEARQPSDRPEFNGEEIRGDEDLAMPAEELQPSRPPRALGGGLNPRTFQNGGDRATAHLVTELASAPWIRV